MRVKNIALQKIIIAIISVLMLASCASQKKYGLFTDASDVGQVKHQGETIHKNGTYELMGSGSNMWFGKDEFHFAYKKLSGDYSIATEGNLIGEGVDAHRKFGIMFRASLDTSAVMVMATVHGDGLTCLQYRKKHGEDMEEIKSPMTMPNNLRLERRGDHYTIMVSKGDDPFWSSGISGLEFPEEFYVGLFVCSHNADVTEKAIFKNVSIKKL